MVLCEALDLLRPDADAEGQLVAAACAMTLDELDAWVDDLADATGPLGDPPQTCTQQPPSPARPAPAGGPGATRSLRPADRAVPARPPALTGTAARRRARSLAGPGRPPTAGREDSMTRRRTLARRCGRGPPSRVRTSTAVRSPSSTARPPSTSSPAAGLPAQEARCGVAWSTSSTCVRGAGSPSLHCMQPVAILAPVERTRGRPTWTSWSSCPAAPRPFVAPNASAISSWSSSSTPRSRSSPSSSSGRTTVPGRCSIVAARPPGGPRRRVRPGQPRGDVRSGLHRRRRPRPRRACAMERTLARPPPPGGGRSPGPRPPGRATGGPRWRRRTPHSVRLAELERAGGRLDDGYVRSA
jgi:hypothetical protein